jgi:polyhydroxyalkanoate synthase
VSTRDPGDQYVDPETWMKTVEVQPGSWWPEWSQWLDQRMSGQVAPPRMAAPRKGLKVVEDAPGSYVFD